MAPFGESAIEEFKESGVFQRRRFQNLYMAMNLTASAHEVGGIVKVGSSCHTQVDAGFLQADGKYQPFVAAIETVPQLFPFRGLKSFRKDLSDDLPGGQGQQLSFRT